MDITVQDFKEYFYRDFPFASDDDPNNTDYIIDKDIEKAIDEATLNFNQNLFEVDGTDKYAKIAFLYLVAYYLLIDISNAQLGLSSKFQGLIASKSVGDVSESYSVPTWMTSSPVYSQYALNGYGMKYLTFLAPRLKGNILTVAGATTLG